MRIFLLDIVGLNCPFQLLELLGTHSYPIKLICTWKYPQEKYKKLWSWNANKNPIA